MDILVAKTYQGLPVVGEPYDKNGKTYCKVLLKNKSEKEVRVYTEKEYKRMYPDITLTETKKPVKGILGFKDDYILIFKGKVKENEEWFERNNPRYHVLFGWYVPSDETVPVLPEGVMAVVLPWSSVGDKDGNLLSNDEVLKGIARAKKGY